MDHGSIKPKPLLGEILPGFATIAVIGGALSLTHWCAVKSIFHSNNAIAILAAIGAAGFIGAWIVGTVLVSLGNLLEWPFDKLWPLNWDYVLTAPIEDFERFDEWYFACYLLNRSYILGILVVLCLRVVAIIPLPVPLLGGLVIVGVLLLVNAISLRIELRACMGQGPPDDGVYARLKPSTVHLGGVGVFAIRNIPAGTYVFEPDDGPVVHVSAAKVAKLAPELRKLYKDFGPYNNGKHVVPPSLNKLTLSWYLNEPGVDQKPNLGCDKRLHFFALREINVGEELLADYSKYSEEPPA